MANKKISQLTELTSPDITADFLPIVDNSATETKKINLNSFPFSQATGVQSLVFGDSLTFDGGVASGSSPVYEQLSVFADQMSGSSQNVIVFTNDQTSFFPTGGFLNVQSRQGIPPNFTYNDNYTRIASVFTGALPPYPPAYGNYTFLTVNKDIDGNTQSLITTSSFLLNTGSFTGFGGQTALHGGTARGENSLAVGPSAESLGKNCFAFSTSDSVSATAGGPDSSSTEIFSIASFTNGDTTAIIASQDVRSKFIVGETYVVRSLVGSYSQNLTVDSVVYNTPNTEVTFTSAAQNTYYPNYEIVTEQFLLYKNNSISLGEANVGSENSVGIGKGSNAQDGTIMISSNSDYEVSSDAKGAVVIDGSTSSSSDAGLCIHKLSAGTPAVGVKNEDPSTELDINGAITLQELSSTPSATPVNGSEAQIYVKADKLIVRYNDGGTTRYKYLSLAGTSTTWTHTTSAP